MTTRRPSRREARQLLFPAASLLLLTTLAACGGAGGPATPANSTASVYSVRGEILRLPDPATHGSDREVWIRHESIPDFKSSSGEVVGMESMTMPFQVAADARTDGLEVGDRVAFDLRVDWQGKGAPAEVSNFRKLASGTPLEFDADAGSAEAPPADATAQPGATPK
jgi:Cu/Ag efflux protein CusF